VIEDEHGKFTFFASQLTGAAWPAVLRLSGMGVGILADDVGLGKTFTTILYLWHRYRKLLVRFRQEIPGR
jgi:SNF2 family DNA or RNA helicase